MAKKVDLSISIVTYKSMPLINECLDAIFSSKTKYNYEVIMIENNSGDEIVKHVNKYYPQVKTIDNKDNVGFGSGHNKAISVAEGEYILILNPDAILGSDSIERLLQAASLEPILGILAPKLTFPDGRLQRSAHRRMPAWQSHFVHYNFLLFTFIQRRNIEYDYTLFDIQSHDQRLYAKHVMGAVMLMRRDVFINIGRFDETFFMYLEETDMCLRLQKLGRTIIYEPSIKVVHALGASTAENELGQGSPMYLQSIYHYFHKHKGMPYTQILYTATIFSLLINKILLTLLLFIAKYSGRKESVITYIKLGMRLTDRSLNWHWNHKGAKL
jgi:GT2 family glycosyltransferase